MSQQTVLYDLPGPKARRRSQIGAVVVLLVAAALVYVAVGRLNESGQFEYDKWGGLIDPGNDDFAAVWRLIRIGLQATLIAAALAIVFSLILGTIAASSRMLLGKWGRIPLVGLMELLRGLPVVILIFIAYRVLPETGIDVGPLPGSDGLWFLVIGLTAYNSVIIAEILRAGVASLPRGQAEAATAIGLSRIATMRMILLPQAFRIMLPALISQLVVVLKDTSLAGLIAVYDELLKNGLNITLALKNPIQTYFVIGVIYVVINLLLSLLANRVERRLSRAGAPTAEAATKVTDTGGATAVNAGGGTGAGA